MKKLIVTLAILCFAVNVLADPYGNSGYQGSSLRASNIKTTSFDGTCAGTDTVQECLDELDDAVGGSGAPTDVNYLVGTASGGLSAEIVVGTTPGGELGGNWGSPTIDDGLSVANWSFTDSINIPNGTGPTTDAVGELAFDTDAQASGRGSLQIYDGTANTYAVAVLASDTCTNGQIPTWNTGGTWTCEDASGGGLTVGSTSIASGGANRILYENGSTTLSSSADLTFDTTNGLIVNDSGGTAVDVRAEGDTVTNLLFVDASADKVGIGANPTEGRLVVKTAVSGGAAIYAENTSGNVGDNAVRAINPQGHYARLAGHTSSVGSRWFGVMGDITSNNTGVAVIALGGAIDSNMMSNYTAANHISLVSSGRALFGTSSTSIPNMELWQLSGMSAPVFEVFSSAASPLFMLDENGAMVPQVKSLTIADSGNGSPAAGTLTPTTSYSEITCNDADGCTLEISETGARQGQMIFIVNVSANTVTLNDTSGQTETSNPALGQYDTATLIYASDRWIQYGTSNN